jgi:hypothetical protein
MVVGKGIARAVLRFPENGWPSAADVQPEGNPMRQSIQAKRLLGLFAALAALCVGLPGSARAAAIIEDGWDLFVTQGGTFFDFGGALGLNVVDFEGDLLETFDFGSGPVGVGHTDTIIHRIDPAGDGILDNDTIDIEIVALSLISVDQFDLGSGLENLLIGLNSDLGSTMTISGLLHDPLTDPHGTFDSTLHFNFDVTGTVSGFLTTLEKTFIATDQDWNHEPVGPVQISGVNYELNGAGDLTRDFAPQGLVVHDTGGGKHVASIPEPSTASLLGLGLLSMAAVRRRRTAA